MRKLKGVVKFCDIDMLWYIDFDGFSKDFSYEFISVTEIESILNRKLQEGDIVEIEIKVFKQNGGV